MTKPKIILADDHFLFRDGIKTMLQLDNIADVIAEASDGEQLLELLKIQQPDILLTDIDMPKIDGIQATQQATRLYPDLKVIALTMFGDEAFYKQMIEAGAKGFLLKTSDKAELEDAIQKVYLGNSYFSNELLQRLLLNMNKNQEGSRNVVMQERFSDREIEILELLALGFSTAEIANEVFLSVKTVENYRAKLLNKTGSKNSTGLVVFAIKNNLIQV